jgi:phage minor structural protein
MILATADGLTVYDSRLSDRALLGLKVTAGLNKGGAAEITMPPGHPAYNSFTMYRSIVEISRDNELLFRGRPLYPTDDNYNCRKITCEGERCFLRDAAMRPYLYQDTPAAIFADVIGIYNSQVEAAKSFQVGTVTVTDANDYVRLESEKAEQVADTIDKLVERCGGYIVFTTNTEGQRVINWYESLGYQSSQVIEFGVNLLDYTRSQASTDLATRIIPYGAKNEETGERVTIESVNDGLDFIEDADAVALRGVIARPVYWADVTEPANLLRKAQQYLATSKMIISSLELSAVDLSILDKDIDSLRVGDTIQVRSRPHNVDDRFLLQQRTYDLLDPAQDKVVLGKDLATLTGAGVAGDRDTMSELHRTEHIIKADYTLGIANAVKTTQETLFSLIQQTSDAIRLEVSETYATNDAVQSQISTTLTQLADSFNFEFESLRAVVDENDAEARTQFETIHKYIRFEDGNIILGEEGNELTLRIENDRIGFLDGGAEVAYFSNKMLYVLDGHFLHSLQVGKFSFLPRENGNLSLVKVVQ